jgi:hypothetical protein
MFKYNNIHILALMLGPKPRGFISRNKTNLAYAYWPMNGIFLKHIGSRLE